MRTPRCCPEPVYPCYYGNTEQSRTITCESYWEDQSSVTETIAADTIFVATCQNEADAIARELALYQAQDITQCQTECQSAACVSLSNPEDIEHFEYWTIANSVLFSQDVEICLSDLSLCEDVITNYLLFRPIDSVVPFPDDVELVGNSDYGDTCGTLLGGVIYTFTSNFGESNLEAPERYSIGWECNQNCAPKAQSDYVLTFPFGLAYKQPEA